LIDRIPSSRVIALQNVLSRFKIFIASFERAATLWSSQNIDNDIMELPNRATDLPEPLLTYLVKLLMFGLESHLKVGLLLTKGECLRDKVDNMTKAP
jgi:hypothetical protein